MPSMSSHQSSSMAVGFVRGYSTIRNSGSVETAPSSARHCARNTLADYFTEQGDHDGREEKSTQPGKDGVRQQCQQDVGADVAPDHGRQDLVGVLAQFEHPRGIGVAGI